MDEEALTRHGLPLPPGRVRALRWIARNGDWWAETDDGRWFWLRTQDVARYEWKEAPAGPP